MTGSVAKPASDGIVRIVRITGSIVGLWHTVLFHDNARRVTDARSPVLLATVYSQSCCRHGHAHLNSRVILEACLATQAALLCQRKAIVASRLHVVEDDVSVGLESDEPNSEEGCRQQHVC